MKCNEIKDEMFQFDVLKCNGVIWYVRYGSIQINLLIYSASPINLSPSFIIGKG